MSDDTAALDRAADLLGRRVIALLAGTFTDDPEALAALMQALGSGGEQLAAKSAMVAPGAGLEPPTEPAGPTEPEPRAVEPASAADVERTGGEELVEEPTQLVTAAPGVPGEAEVTPTEPEPHDEPTEGSPPSVAPSAIPLEPFQTTVYLLDGSEPTDPESEPTDPEPEPTDPDPEPESEPVDKQVAGEAEPGSPPTQTPPAVSAPADRRDGLPTLLAEAVEAAAAATAALEAATRDRQRSDLGAVLTGADAIAATLRRERGKPGNRAFMAALTAALRPLREAIEVARKLPVAGQHAAPLGGRPARQKGSDAKRAPAKAATDEAEPSTNRTADGRRGHRSPASVTPAPDAPHVTAKPNGPHRNGHLGGVERRKSALNAAGLAAVDARTMAQRIRAALDGEEAPAWLSELERVALPLDSSTDDLEAFAAVIQRRTNQGHGFLAELEGRRAAEAADVEAQRAKTAQATREGRAAELKAKTEAICLRARALLDSGVLPEDQRRTVETVLELPEQPTQGWLSRAEGIVRVALVH